MALKRITLVIGSKLSHQFERPSFIYEPRYGEIFYVVIDTLLALKVTQLQIFVSYDTPRLKFSSKSVENCKKREKNASCTCNTICWESIENCEIPFEIDWRADIRHAGALSPFADFLDSKSDYDDLPNEQFCDDSFLHVITCQHSL